MHNCHCLNLKLPFRQRIYEMIGKDWEEYEQEYEQMHIH